MSTVIIIPARYHSVRLPQKPLAVIAGKTLTERVYNQAAKAKGIDAIYVATDHEAVAQEVERFGGTCILTSPAAPSGTDRVAEAIRTLETEREAYGPYDVVINLQGDEPLVPPEVLSELASAMVDRAIDIATPVSPIRTLHDLLSPNVVKVVRSTTGDGLYFSRHPIPYVRDLMAEAPSHALLASYPFVKHIGIYAFRRHALDAFVELGESMLERTEKLEQLRLLEAGFRIRTIEVEYDSIAVDVLEDLARVEAALAGSLHSFDQID